MSTTLLRRPVLRRRRPARGPAAWTAVVVLAVAGCGEDGDVSTAPARDRTGSSAGPRTVEIEMVDNAFDPTEVEVDAGETVRFVFRNGGEVTHDAVIGDEAAQDLHEAEMRAAEAAADDMDSMDHGATSEDQQGAITVDPGETGELTHTFASGEELLIGCHELGHYDAGMKVDVDVVST